MITLRICRLLETDSCVSRASVKATVACNCMQQLHKKPRHNRLAQSAIGRRNVRSVGIVISANLIIDVTKLLTIAPIGEA